MSRGARTRPSTLVGAWVGNGLVTNLGDFESIATTTVGSGGTATITFSNIPQTYKHLQIRALTRDTQAGNDLGAFRMTVNSDTSSTYTRHIVYGDGASALAGYNATTGYALTGLFVTGGSTASMFAVNIIDVLDYANTNKFKTFRVLAGADKNGSGQAFLNSNLWQSSSAVTTLSFVPGASSNWAEYSSFALYGIK